MSCMLGEKITVLRRKADRLCLSASNWCGRGAQRHSLLRGGWVCCVGRIAESAIVLLSFGFLPLPGSARCSRCRRARAAPSLTSSAHTGALQRTWLCLLCVVSSAPQQSAVLPDDAPSPTLACLYGLPECPVLLSARFERAATGECVQQVDFAPTVNCPARDTTATRLTAGNKCGGSGGDGKGNGGGNGNADGGESGRARHKNQEGGGLSGGAIFFIVLLVLFFVTVAGLLGAKKAGVRLPAQDHIDGCGLRVVDLFNALRAKLSGNKSAGATNYDWLEPLEEEDFRPLEERYVPPKL